MYDDKLCLSTHIKQKPFLPRLIRKEKYPKVLILPEFVFLVQMEGLTSVAASLNYMQMSAVMNSELISCKDLLYLYVLYVDNNILLLISAVAFQ